jgi:hypothetical protein
MNLLLLFVMFRFVRQKKTLNFPVEKQRNEENVIYIKQYA